MSRKIVVIDDEPDVLQIVKAALTTRNYTVFTTHDGLEGIEIAEREQPDLIICDLMMPRTSGLEVLKRLRKNDAVKAIPVIILSALGNDDRPADFWVRALGVAEYIQKPFDPLDLLGRVEYVFRRASYVSAQYLEGSARPTSPPPGKERRPASPEDYATRAPVEVGECEPAEVVRQFIESYNRQDFATEFQCLDAEMTGGADLHGYVDRRRQTYLDEKSEGRVQRLANVEEEKISLNMAKVVVTREDTVSGTARSRRETYMLKKTYQGWKIIGVRSAKS